MPLAILLIPYALFVLLYASWSGAWMYHLFHYGFHGVQAWTITGLHLAVSVFLLIMSLGAIAGVNWSAPLTLTITSNF